MGTTPVTEILDEARYDLIDHGKQKFDNTYLLKMLNRGLKVLERELIAIRSDIVARSTTGTLAAGDKYLPVSKTVDSINRLYIGQVELYQIQMEHLLRRQIDYIGSSTGEPQYFAVWALNTDNVRSVLFDYTADQDYTITYIYNYAHLPLTVEDMMPYDDMFNEYLREGIVLLSHKTKDDTLPQADRVWRELARSHMFQLSTSFGHIPKHYHIDF